MDAGDYGGSAEKELIRREDSGRDDVEKSGRESEMAFKNNSADFGRLADTSLIELDLWEDKISPATESLETPGPTTSEEIGVTVHAGWGARATVTVYNDPTSNERAVQVGFGVSAGFSLGGYVYAGNPNVKGGIPPEGGSGLKPTPTLDSFAALGIGAAFSKDLTSRGSETKTSVLGGGIGTGLGLNWSYTVRINRD
jgi:hypothetical protein